MRTPGSQVPVAFALVWMLSLAVPSAFAQKAATPTVRQYGGGLGFEWSFATTSLAAGPAQRQGTGTRSYGMSFGIGIETSRKWLLGLQLGLANLHDDSSHSYRVEGGETVATGLSMTDWAVVGGVRLLSPRRRDQMWRPAIAATTGVASFKTTRSVPNCMGCNSESLAYGGGFFVAPVVSLLKIGDVVGWELQAAIRYYPFGDTRTTLLLGAKVLLVP